MPAAIPIAATVGSTLIGSLLQNGQNKANQQNATAATDSARTNDQQALASALQQLQTYQQTNKAPSASYGPVQGPASVYGQGAPTVNSPQTPVPGFSLLAALAPGAQRTTQPVARTAGNPNVL